MNHILTVHDQDKPIYDIQFEENFNQMPSLLERLGAKKRKVCIVTDENISKYYLNELSDMIKEHVSLLETLIITPGEEYKNLDTVYQVYEHLIQNKFDRNDMLIALGGGVVGDLTGYAAATYLRGIDFIQMPTTLLSMTDSSIGGKTGVDFQSYKNMVGAFYQPKAVYMNLSTLNTLSDSLFYSGFGEIIKHGFIKDLDYYNWLRENHNAIEKKEYQVLAEMIYRSCGIKKAVVENDPKEKGERALLNFGHTLGHAIEKLMDFQLLHGECVAIGSIGAAYISMMRGLITEATLLDITAMMEMYHLPVRLDKKKAHFGIDDIIAATKNDKKMDSGNIKFILLNEIGLAVIDNTVTDEEMKSAIEYIMV